MTIQSDFFSLHCHGQNQTVTQLFSHFTTKMPVIKITSEARQSPPPKVVTPTPSCHTTTLTRNANIPNYQHSC
ncbi:hypothetical protein GCM10009615_24360 [Corynebacterium durum]